MLKGLALIPVSSPATAQVGCAFARGADARVVAGEAETSEALLATVGLGAVG